MLPPTVYFIRQFLIHKTQVHVHQRRGLGYIERRAELEFHVPVQILKASMVYCKKCNKVYCKNKIFIVLHDL